MATKRMLIDATHTEETRVVVVSGNRLEDFDVEVESRRQLKGNIYLAKVTRVEPSLQAAFVDFGGNRHGFLAFNEIHPDYYQIPIADREALLAEEREAEIAAAEKDGPEDGDDDRVETVGGDDEEDVEVRRPVNLRRNYKIQEVIKRRQILLVQVVKEERGNKGAALTTYISLPGRYCVLMPNTGRGGGISRKIGHSNDRKRLKSILSDLNIPDGMAVIVRTAGAKRTKAEIKRDYDYLLRLWTQIRETTLESIAPCLIHEEGNLIKRAIRDLYTKDLEEVLVDGESAYRTAKDFMKLLIPSHAKRVKRYKETNVPMFHRYQVESQLESIHEAQVSLRSGGYIVMNQTEALVAIDVNSGRATKERNIEETALQTNLEAAEEIARQLRLRDLAGLIVIDFIDMEVHRNQAKVERALKDAMKYDRARIQLGRISPFGLLELSRQRLRPSIMETISVPCTYCGGTGIRRSVDSSALSVIRAIEEEGMRGRSSEITVHVATPVALYILNQKRDVLVAIEQRYDFRVFLKGDDALIPPDHRIDRVKGIEVEGEDTSAREPAHEAVEGEEARTTDEEEETGRKKRRRRPRRRRQDDEATGESAEDAGEEQAEAVGAAGDASESRTEEGDDANRAKRRRRGRRGGRRRRKATSGEAREDESNAAEQEATGGDGDEARRSTEQQSGDMPLLAESPVAGLLSGNESDGSVIELPDATEEAAPPTADNEDGAKSRSRSRKTSARGGRTRSSDKNDEAEATSEVPSAQAPDMGAAASPAVDADSGEPAKTVTVDVGSDVGSEEETESDAPRRGWWRRSTQQTAGE